MNEEKNVDGNYKLNIKTSVAEMYEQYTRYSYTEEYALAEFIDNSTASFYLNEQKLLEEHVDKLFININYDETENTLTIHDEAFGMEREDFDDALIVGKKPKYKGRNEFGYGLKTAATWFGRHWSVTSSQFGSEKKYFGYIDLDELKESGSDEIPIVVSSEKYEKHYTDIVISKLNRQLSGRKIKNKIIEILNSMYRRDLVSGKIEIMYNGTTLEFSEYEPLVFKDTIYKKNISLSFEALGKKYNVNGFVGILKDGSFKKGGFALLRNNRVIVDQYRPKEIFVQLQNAISKNMYGELDMIDFNVNQAKDGFSWPAEVEENFIIALKETVSDYTKIAKLTIQERNREEAEYQKLKNPVQNLGNDDKENSENDKVDSNVDDSNDNSHNASEKQNNNDANSSDESKGQNDSSKFASKTYKTELIDNTNFSICLGDNDYIVEWKAVENKYFLYFFDEALKKLIINLNHPFPNNCKNESRYDVSKLLLSYILSDLNARKAVNSDGYVASSAIRNNINKLLNE